MTNNESFILSGPHNGLFARIDGKNIALRYTKHQASAYADYLATTKKKIDARSAEAEAELKKNPDKIARFDHALQVREMALDALDLCVIAFNPEPDKLDYTREMLESKFDVDHMRIIASEWQQRKIYDPQANRPNDPLLPQTVEAAK